MKKYICFMLAMFCIVCSVNAETNTGSISGYVLDKMTKEPINGAKVEIYGVSVLTNKKGYFVITDLPTGNLIMEIDALDHSRYMDTVSIVSGEIFEKIYLQPASDTIVVMGIVRDKVRNRPVKNANVSLDNQVVKTNSAGKYRIAGVAPGNKILDVLKSGYQTYTEKVFVDEHHRVLNVNILPNAPFGILYGKVINTMSGKPVRGALVEIGSYKSVTGLDGSYELKGLEPGQHPLKIKAYNYKTTIDSIQISAARKEVIFKLMPQERYGVVEGIVKSAGTSSAIAGAEIQIGGNKAISGYDGSFIVKDVAVGVQDIQAVHADHIDHQEKLVVSEGKQTFVIVMRPQTKFAIVKGTVKDRTDMFAITEAKVSCGEKFAFTDKNGKFVLKDVVTGSRNIVVNARGYKINQNTIHISEGVLLLNILLEKQIAAGIMNKKEFTETVLNTKKKNKDEQSDYFSDVSMEKNEIASSTSKVSKGSIEGIIIDDLTSQPIKNADVMIQNKTVRTDKNGRYQIKDLEYGEYTVTVITEKNAVFVNRTTINDLKNIFNIKLCAKTASATVYGKIYDETNELPVAHAQIKLGDRTIVSDEDGKYQFPSTVEDFYDFSVEYKGYNRYENIIKVTDGNVRLDVYLKRIQ